jgi:RNA polymerase sigma-70 factor (ECF subfamily)
MTMSSFCGRVGLVDYPSSWSSEYDSHLQRSNPAAARRARFAALARAHTGTLEAVARQLCRVAATAADLVQDTLERAWRHLDALQDDERARAWLVRILRNAWLDQLRRRRAEVPLDETHEAACAPADEPSWWEQITAEDLRRAIEQLAEPYRTVAVLHDVEGRSYREIARLLGIPNATAATQLHRAHVRLRALLRRQLGIEEG